MPGETKMKITKEAISKIELKLEWARQTIKQYNKHEQNEELKDAIEDIKEALKIIKGETTE